MVDKEKVVKALQCCTGDASRCDECPYDNKCLSEDETENTFFKDILEVINHYEEQVQKLEKVEHFATKTIEKQEAEIEELRADNNYLFETMPHMKTEAIKEFAEKLKENTFKHTNFGELVYVEDIDNLVKEMTEQRKEDEGE